MTIGEIAAATEFKRRYRYRLCFCGGTQFLKGLSSVEFVFVGISLSLVRSFEACVLDLAWVKSRMLHARGA